MKKFLMQWKWIEIFRFSIWSTIAPAAVLLLVSQIALYFWGTPESIDISGPPEPEYNISHADKVRITGTLRRTIAIEPPFPTEEGKVTYICRPPKCVYHEVDVRSSDDILMAYSNNEEFCWISTWSPDGGWGPFQCRKFCN